MADLQSIGIIGAIFGAGGIGSYFSGRYARENKLIDQLQEEMAKKDASIARQDRIIRLQADYIGSLRKQVVDEVGPPPLPYPTELNS